MDFSLDKKHEMARSLFRDFAENEVKPLAQEVDETEVFPQGTVDKMAKYGFMGIPVPSFCTACYRAGRTGDRFMSLLKSKQIINCCHPNALMTLKEYLEDYASPETKAVGEKLIADELKTIPNETVRKKAAEYIENIHEGQRDFRF